MSRQNHPWAKERNFCAGAVMQEHKEEMAEHYKRQASKLPPERQRLLDETLIWFEEYDKGNILPIGGTDGM